MPTTPRVTVLITLYNKGPYVEEAVRSVLEQTFTDFELLVVDDASTDGGLERVKRFSDSRIRILESRINTGRPSAANRGYAAARGAYVAVLDADDIMLPERLALQVEFMANNPQVGALGTDAQATGASAHSITFDQCNDKLQAKPLFGSPILYGSAMIRRDVLAAHGIKCREDWQSPGMDRLFLLEIGKHAAYANLPKVLTLYRLGPQNMRHARDGAHDMKVLIRAVMDFYGIPASDRELELQAMLHRGLGGKTPGPRQVWAIGRWRDKLFAMNRKRGWFPAEPFEQLFDRHWHELFHDIVQKDAMAGLLHMTLTGHLIDRTGYWAKATKDRWHGGAKGTP